VMIACLGWGSLVWDPRELPVHGKWFEDGPFLPIEFARQSKDGRLTLVLVPEYANKIRSLWTLFSVGTVAEAREALRQRECVLERNRDRHINAWSTGDAPPASFPEIARWVVSKGVDAAVWTALPPKFGDNEVRPDADQAVAYLRQRSHEQRRNAERYVRMTPRQIDTPYRRRFEAEFGWTPHSVV
jgi:hypothetical protein